MPTKAGPAPVTVDNDPGSDVPVHAGQVIDDPPGGHEGHSHKEAIGGGMTVFAEMAPHTTC